MHDRIENDRKKVNTRINTCICSFDLKLYILYIYSGIASSEAHITLPLHVYVQFTPNPRI